MAAAPRSFARALRTAAPTFKTTTRRSAPFSATQQPFRQQFRRGYSSGKEGSEGGNPSALLWGGVGLAAIAGGYGLYLAKPDLFGQEAKPKGPFVPKFEDYQQVYNAVAKQLEEK